MLSPPFMMIVESEMERYRRDTWKSKEYETIAWIDSFADGSLFFDIGANVGIYSLYCAAVHPGCRIFAFEPDAKNFARLGQNIEANAFDHIITAAQYGVADEDCRETFWQRTSEVGASGGQLGYPPIEDTVELPIVVQVHTLDSLAARFGCPTHIKIDIDGQELRVVRGMKATLENPGLRSVLIEVDLEPTPARAEIMGAFLGAGFKDGNRFNTMLPHSRTRRAAEGIRVENVVFTRS